MNNRIDINKPEDLAESELVMRKQGPVGHVQSIELVPATTAKRVLQFTAVIAFVFVFYAHQRGLQTGSEIASNIAVAPASLYPVGQEIIPMENESEAPNANNKPEKDVALVNERIEARKAPATVPLGGSGANPLVINPTPESNVAPENILSISPAVDMAAVVAAETTKEEPHKARAQLNELKQLKMDLLAKKAQIALQKDRLTTPTYDNAANYYYEILALDSKSLVARQGLLRVAQRYHEIASALQARGERAEAANVLALARTVLPKEISTLPPLQSAHNKPDTENVISAMTTNPALKKDRPTQLSSRPTSREYVGQSSQSTRTEAKAAAARALLQGDAETARQVLRPLMSQQGEDGELVALMHQVHMSAGELELARELRLQAQGDISTYHSARMQANELLVEGNSQQAVQILEANLPEFNQDPTYYGLLAGLYFKVGRFAEAQTAYQQLLTVDPDVGRYWLGYAVALDAQGKAKEAASAFSRARQMLPDSDSAIAYIDQRVRALGAF